MDTSKDKIDIFYVLCARSLQRHGGGFPSTEEEIEAFKASCEITEKEKEAAKKMLGVVIENAYEAVNEKSDKKVQTLYDRLPEFQEENLPYAARNAKKEQLSIGLEEKINKIIEDNDSKEK